MKIKEIQIDRIYENQKVVAVSVKYWMTLPELNELLKKMDEETNKNESDNAAE